MVLVQRRRESDESLVSVCPSAFELKQPMNSSDPPEVPPSMLLQRQGSEVPRGSPDFSLYSSDVGIHPQAATRATRKPTYTFERTKRVQTLLWRAIYIILAFMWIGGYRHYDSTESFYKDLLEALEKGEDKTSNHQNTLENIQLQVRNLKGRLSQMSAMSRAFQHELRMIQEMAEEKDTVDMHMTESEMSRTGPVSRWIQQRKRGLEHRVQNLRSQVQELSKQAVLEKWGPGPHRIKFKVHVLYDSQENGFGSNVPMDKSAFVRNRGVRVKKDIVVELAPLDAMPHAVFLFLELVESKLWDNTIFLHNDRSDRVMAVAPVDYVSHNLKVDHLDGVSHFSSLGFPEYSPEYPHRKYTLGFADRGPTFYVNTMDNVEQHGPGGQDHFSLQGDADPCFGTVVRGREVIDFLVSSGVQANNRLNPKADHPWKDQTGLHFTRIISLELMR